MSAVSSFSSCSYSVIMLSFFGYLVGSISININCERVMVSDIKKPNIPLLSSVISDSGGDWGDITCHGQHTRHCRQNHQLYIKPTPPLLPYMSFLQNHFENRKTSYSFSESCDMALCWLQKQVSKHMWNGKWWRLGQTKYPTRQWTKKWKLELKSKCCIARKVKIVTQAKWAEDRELEWAPPCLSSPDNGRRAPNGLKVVCPLKKRAPLLSEWVWQCDMPSEWADKEFGCMDQAGLCS